MKLFHFPFQLLAETEGSNVRLTEQIKLLKSEIRR